MIAIAMVTCSAPADCTLKFGTAHDPLAGTESLNNFKFILCINYISCAHPWMVMLTTCHFLSAAEGAIQTLREAKLSATALQEDKHTHYSVSSIKQLQLNRPLDRLISARS